MSDPYGGKVVGIGPWQPIPPGECVCSGIGNFVSRVHSDCPRHALAPRVTTEQWERLELISEDTPEQTWDAVELLSAMPWWKPGQVRPMYVDSVGVRWICGRRMHSDDRVRVVHLQMATTTGGTYSLEMPSVRLHPNTLELVAGR